MKKFNLLLIGALAIFGFTSSVNASTFINNKNVEISNDFVNIVSDYLKPEIINNLNEQEYKFYYDLYTSNYAIEEEYVVTSNLIQNNEILDSVSTTMTEEEYQVYQSTYLEPLTVCYEEDACWETSSKRITLTTANSTNCSVSVGVEWFSVPKVQSYDVIATMWSGNATKNYSFANQFYIDSSGNTNKIDYDTTAGNNTKNFSNGIGTSMNLTDGALGYSLYLSANLNCSSGITFRGSYQHATSGVSLATSKNYTLSTSGYGGVINFASSSANYYDGMQGVVYYAAKS